MGESTTQKMRRALSIQRALQLVWQAAPKWTVANGALVVVQGVFPLLALYLMKLVVDSVTEGIAADDKVAAFTQVALYIALAAGAALLTALLGAVSKVVKEYQSQLVADHVNNVLHAKSVKVDLEYYENPQYHDTLYRAQQEAPYRPSSIVSGLVQTAQNVISLLAMAGLLLSFHWGVAAVLLAAVAPGLLVQIKYSGEMYRWGRRRTPTQRAAAYFSWMMTVSMFAKEIRLFGLGTLFTERFRRLRRLLRGEELGIVTKRSRDDLLAQAGATVALFGAYAFIAYRTVQGAITLGDMVMYYGAFQRGLSSLREVFTGLAGLYEHSLFVSNLYEFLDLKPRVAEPAHPKAFPASLLGGIEFDHVSFHYPCDGNKVLDNVNLSIKPGETIALVGENGSGKTTLVKLLCRLYDPTEGAIRIDGVDLREFDTNALRREIGIVFQDYAHYNLTARENIWFGDPHLPSDDERIVHAARNSGADEVIQGLEHGYATVLGKWFENGEELSIGEWQKVALARAFLRSAKIVILDEPTSAMDAKAEYALFKKFHRLSEGRTAVLISHRFSTVRIADRIFVLEGGGITESGSHDELVARGGQYARLFETQAQYYR